MVNGINSVVNFKELQEKKESPPENIGMQLLKKGVPLAYLYPSKYERAFKWCYRRNIGTYPKWILSPMKKVLRFIVKTCLRHKIEFTARGRGPRPQGCRQDLPIKLAKRVAIYVSIYRR
jgi:hypothetical protein